MVSFHNCSCIQRGWQCWSVATAYYRHYYSFLWSAKLNVQAPGINKVLLHVRVLAPRLQLELHRQPVRDLVITVKICSFLITGPQQISDHERTAAWDTTIISSFTVTLVDLRNILTSSMRFLRCWGFATWHTTPLTSQPRSSFSNSETALETLSCFRLLIMTLAPSRTSCLAIPNPILKWKFKY